MCKSSHRAIRLLRAASLLLAVSLPALNSQAAGVFPNGVNLQPTYYNGGNVNFGWSLMNAQSAIQACRLEIDPSRGISISQMQSWISQVRSNGKTLICTYHFFGGSDSAADLSTAATWWRTNYSALNSAGSFTVNLCNEWGSHNLTSNAYASAYNSAISTVRQVYSGRIVVDVPGWGQEMQVAQLAITGSGTRINDTNIVLSAHIYPGNFDQVKNRGNIPADLDDLAASGRPCMIGEFGTGSGGTDWSAMVDKATSLGWTKLAWSWNGDGGVLNMVSPSWASTPTATSFSTNSYFNTVYPKLSGGGGGGGGLPAAGTYSLQNRTTGKMLDNLGSTANGANVAQWADGSSNNQRWTLSFTGGFAKLMCVTGSKFLDSLGHTGNNSTVGQQASSTSNNQQWTLQDAGGGYFRIINRANGLCVDGAGSTTDGTVAVFWNNNPSNNQQWRFVAP